MPDENSKTVTTTTDTKTLIVEQFGRAGPWAVLAVLILVGVGYEADYFLKRYVQQSDMTMQALRKSGDNLAEAVGKNLDASTKILEAIATAHEQVTRNGEMMKASQEQHGTLIQLLNEAAASMKPVGEERKRQTAILEKIQAAVERQP